MGFQKKTKHALKTLFFGGVQALLEYKIERAKYERDELVDRIGALESFRSDAADAFHMVWDPGRSAKPQVDEVVN